jgi:hypothetical protein
MADRPEVLTQALTALLPTGGPVRVSRDLLIEVLECGPAGVVDVQFRADGSCVECVWLLLDNASGHTALLVAVDELTDLAARIDLVPGDGCPIEGDAEHRTLAEWGL